MLAFISALMSGPIPSSWGRATRVVPIASSYGKKSCDRTVSPNFVYAECKAASVAVASGFGPGWAELAAAEGGRMGDMKPEYSRNIRLVADFPITGKVVDTGGKPVAGVAIAVDRIFELSDPRWKLMHPAIDAGNPFLMTRPQCDTNNWFTPLYPTAFKMIPPAVTDSEGRFRLAGTGGDRAIRLQVSGPGIRSDTVSVLTRDDVADFTRAIRTKYPRTPRTGGYFYPPRASAPEGDQGVRIFGPSATIDVDPARTVSGVVRDETTGEPIAGHRMGIATGSGYASSATDSRGRYRILHDDDQPSIVMFSDYYQTDRYLTVVRRLDAGKGFGEIVADFNIPRGVVINGRVLEAGTDRPIVSARDRGATTPCQAPCWLAMCRTFLWLPIGRPAHRRGFTSKALGAVRIIIGPCPLTATDGFALPFRRDRAFFLSRRLPGCRCLRKTWRPGRRVTDISDCSPT